MLVITVARKPLGGTVVDNIALYGCSGLNIDCTRVQGTPWSWGKQTDLRGGGYGTRCPSQGDVLAKNVCGGVTGRWPANLLLQHSQGCQIIGHEEVPGYVINRWDEGAKPFGGGAGHPYTGSLVETVEALKERGIIQAGKTNTKRQSGKNALGNGSPAFGSESRPSGSVMIAYGDAGWVSRYFKQVKE
jgi:hypothetical protein